MITVKASGGLKQASTGGQYSLVHGGERVILRGRPKTRVITKEANELLVGSAAEIDAKIAELGLKTREQVQEEERNSPEAQAARLLAQKVRIEEALAQPVIAAAVNKLRE